MTELTADLIPIEGSSGLYHVRFDGKLIIQRSRCPELDLARELLARGFRGKVKILDGITGKLRTTIDIAKAAKLTAKEGRHGPYFAKQTAPDRAPTAETPSLGSPGSPELGCLGGQRMSNRGIGNKSRGKKGGRPFIQFHTNVLRSKAYHSLSAYARAALIELRVRYHGINNGMIVLSVRELAYELRCSLDTARRALVELDDAGLARPITGGHWKGKRATEWRLAFYRCDKTGDLLVNNWERRQVYVSENTKVRLEVHTGSKCTARSTHNRNSSMNDPAKCTATGTHIDIYQGDRDRDKKRIGTKGSNVVELAQRSRRRART
jgi:hypothetical protein